MSSIWTETEKFSEFPALEGSAKTDVLIIGGGIAGILCAYFLKEKGMDYMLVEKIQSVQASPKTLQRKSRLSMV